MNRTARRMNRQRAAGRRTTGKGCWLFGLAYLALVAALVLALTSCKQPDPYGGCSQHPGQCDRTK